MKKLVTLGVVVLAAVTGCTTPAPVVQEERITYSIEAYRLDSGGTEVSAIGRTSVAVGILNISDHRVDVREGASGGWLVLPWSTTDDVFVPIRRQFTYDTRTTKVTDFVLRVSALVTAPDGTHLRCTIFDNVEHPIVVVEETVFGPGGGVVQCASGKVTA